jgi:hypothetical protein
MWLLACAASGCCKGKRAHNSQQLHGEQGARPANLAGARVLFLCLARRRQPSFV